MTNNSMRGQFKTPATILLELLHRDVSGPAMKNFQELYVNVRDPRDYLCRWVEFELLDHREKLFKRCNK